MWYILSWFISNKFGQLFILLLVHLPCSTCVWAYYNGINMETEVIYTSSSSRYDNFVGWSFELISDILYVLLVSFWVFCFLWEPLWNCIEEACFRCMIHFFVIVSTTFYSINREISTRGQELKFLQATAKMELVEIETFSVFFYWVI